MIYISRLQELASSISAEGGMMKKQEIEKLSYLNQRRYFDKQVEIYGRIIADIANEFLEKTNLLDPKVPEMKGFKPRKLTKKDGIELMKMLWGWAPVDEL